MTRIDGQNPGGMGAGNAFMVSDDGTFIIATFGGVIQFKIRKSNGDFLIAGGFQSDQTL